MRTVPGEPPHHLFMERRATIRGSFQRVRLLPRPGSRGGRRASDKTDRPSLVALLCAVAVVGASVYAVTSGFGAPAAVAESPTTVVLNPTADTFVTDLAPNAIGRPDSVIRLDASPRKNGYLRFAIPKSTTSPVGAVLHLYAQSPASAGLAVRMVANDSWTASTLTYSECTGNGHHHTHILWADRRW